MKKLLYKVPLLLCCLIMLCSMSGCFIPKPEDYLPEFENEIFRYAIKTDKIGQKKCYIDPLTEFGHSQTELILPEQIDGIPVRGIGYEKRSTPIWYYESVGCLESENLIKLYVPYDIEKALWDNDRDYTDCPNGRPVIWKGLLFQSFTYEGKIFGYNLLSEYLESLGNSNRPKGLLANVSYMYNYEFAENNGYYWVDSYDNEAISFIPPEPERSGYAFGGWYKEPECVNAWDFETDKTGEEIELRSDNFDGYDANDITFLYAKWIKN